MLFPLSPDKDFRHFWRLGSGLITRREGWQPGGWQNEDVGAAGCKTPLVLLSGKERLDFVTPVIQPLAVMHWFLAAATGWDALLG